jgi:glycosyltransferase involved in cell wall biosynthesis
MKKKHFLEIHTSIFGFTKFLFIFLKFLKSKYIIKVIFITKSLQNYYQKKYSNSLVLADGAEIGDFDIPNKLNKKIKKILYIGSFYKGRGIELILEIAKLCPNYNFTLIGNKSEFDLSTTKITNVKIFDYIKYYSVPKIIKKFDLLLMPYNPNFVQINSDNIKSETSNFMSPLKMFEYLSSGVPFLSSKIKVLNEVLKNNHNCLLVDKYDAYEWAQKIIFIDNNYTLRNKIKKQALLTAQKYSWLNRVKKIVKIFDESKKQ